MKKKHFLTLIIIICSILGILASLKLIAIDQAAKDPLSLLQPCDINDVFSCSKVSQSEYSSTFGISNAVLGVIGYGLIFIMSFVHFLKRYTLKSIPTLLGIIHIGALGFSLYLTGLELFVIHAYCLYCLSSQAIILISSITTLMLYRIKN